jgi:two-component system sensor kinase FixL
MPDTSISSPRMTIRNKVLLGFGIVLAMFGVIMWVSIRSTGNFIRTAEWVAHTHEVLELQERLHRHVMEMEADRRGFIATGNEDLLRGYQEAQTSIIQNFNSLQVLTADLPAQVARLERLKDLIEHSFTLQAAEIDARREKGFGAAMAMMRSGRTAELAERIRVILLEFEADQRRMLNVREDLTGEIAQATTVAVWVGGTLTFGALMIACVLILRDIAARKRAEEALAQEHNLLSSIINAMPNLVFVKDVLGRYIMDNSAHRRYLGVDDVHAIEGHTVFDYFEQSVAQVFADDDREVIESGRPIFNREEPAITLHGPGMAVWLETTKVPLNDTDGRIIGLVGISSDISERKAAEEKLKRFADQLERSNTELQNFASVASHDLQEPLRKIQAFGDRLKAKCGPQLSEQGLDYLARMQNAAQRMQVLIQDLLKLSRVSSRAQPFQKCDLAEIVRAVLSDMEVTIEQSDARIEVGPLPVIDADAIQMRQLFQNLLVNALKFHREGVKPEVKVTGRIRTAVDNSVSGAMAGQPVCEICVEDNGIGFDDKFAEQIFVVFQRLHTRHEYEGTGIGLAVCRKITDRHRGTLVAKSAPGQGATFIITLPVKQPFPAQHE